MSAFSECCRQLLLESGSTVYQIAKQSNLDRTSIQRMITGKRMPSIQFVEKFCSYLRITPIERTELLELYKIEKIGKDLYQNRLYIKTMIESMNQVKHYDTFPAPEHLLENNVLSPNKEFFANSSGEILNMMEYIMREEIKNSVCPEVSTNLPVTYKAFLRLLQRIKFMFHGNLKLRHLFILNKAPALLAKTNYNLEILHEILPLIAEFPRVYQPRYIYSKSTPIDDYYYIYPYYMITSEYLLCISSDFKKASLHHTPIIVGNYKDEFNRLYHTASSLASYHQADCDITAHLLRTLLHSGKPSHIASLNLYPLVFNWPTGTDDSLLASKEQNHLKSILFDEKAIINFYFSLGNSVSSPANLCKGCRTLDQRILLSSYLAKSRTDEIHAYVLKNSFNFPDNLIIMLYETNQIQFLLHTPSTENCITITIEESSVCKSFLDFFDSMEDSDLVHSLSDSDALLSSAIDNLSNNSAR